MPRPKPLALLPWRFILPALAALALLTGLWFGGLDVGAAAVQADWDAQRVADTKAAEAQRESKRQLCSAAASTYEAQRAAIAARLTKPSP